MSLLRWSIKATPGGGGKLRLWSEDGTAMAVEFGRADGLVELMEDIAAGAKKVAAKLAEADEFRKEYPEFYGD